MRRMMTSASSSSLRTFWSGGALGMNMPFQIVRKPLRRRRQARVLGQMVGIRRVVAWESQRPRAARRHRGRLHVEASERAGGKLRIVEQTAVVKRLHRDDGFLRRMRHGGELAIGA